MIEHEYVLRLLDETRHEIDRSDAKAGLLLAAAAAVAAILGTSLLDPGSTLRTSGALAAYLGAGAVGALALSMVFLGLAVVPRVGRPTSGEARYFAEHCQFDSAHDLQAALPKELDDVVGRHVQQVMVLSGIVVAKYRRIRWAIATSGLAVALVAAAVTAAVV